VTLNVSDFPFAWYLSAVQRKIDLLLDHFGSQLDRRWFTEDLFRSLLRVRGMESNSLLLPANTLVELHITSLDVVHSFWAVELGLKADANPGVDNVVYVKTKKPTTFHVRCAELCGLWHGYMFNNGRVVSSAQFASWAAQEQKIYASIKPFMDKSPADGGAPYAHTYLPEPTRRAG